jgi:probable rRNA maturation factor
MGGVRFFTEDTNYKLLNKRKLELWIKSVISSYNKSIGEINFIICSDVHLHQMNVEYLDHDTYTDIITFDNSESDDKIEGELYISIDRIKENANEFTSEVSSELHRVMAHGVLHLIGFKDKTKPQQEEMRINEDHCLTLRDF